MIEGRPRPSVDFADDLAGRRVAEAEARADGWKLILFIAGAIAMITAVLLWHLAVAGIEPADKREDRLTPSPLPKAYCTAPAATGEAG